MRAHEEAAHARAAPVAGLLHAGAQLLVGGHLSIGDQPSRMSAFLQSSDPSSPALAGAAPRCRCLERNSLPVATRPARHAASWTWTWTWSPKSSRRRMRTLGDLVLVATLEVVVAEVFVARASREHVVDDGQQRGSNGAGGFLRAASALDALELRLEVAAQFQRIKAARRSGVAYLAAGRRLPHARARLAPRPRPRPLPASYLRKRSPSANPSP